MAKRIPLFWATVALLVVVYILLRFGVGYFSQAILDAESPQPVPSALLAIYLILTVIGLAVYVAMSDETLNEFIAPMGRLLRGPEQVATREDRLFQGARLAVLAIIPLLVGTVVYNQTAPKVGSPTALRIQHPGLPKEFEDLENPFRTEDQARMALAMEEGRDLYMINCRPCHGTKADGKGPMSSGFRLKPVDFTDSGTIATLVEAYAFWRVKEGNHGLPTESSPWDSAMPVWERDLTDEQIWKIILAEYDIAGVEPRIPE